MLPPSESSSGVTPDASVHGSDAFSDATRAALRDEKESADTSRESVSRARMARLELFLNTVNTLAGPPETLLGAEADDRIHDVLHAERLAESMARIWDELDLKEVAVLSAPSPDVATRPTLMRRVLSVIDLSRPAGTMLGRVIVAVKESPPYTDTLLSLVVLTRDGDLLLVAPEKDLRQHYLETRTFRGPSVAQWNAIPRLLEPQGMFDASAPTQKRMYARPLTADTAVRARIEPADILAALETAVQRHATLVTARQAERSSRPMSR